jgi:hypothetical protein
VRGFYSNGESDNITTTEAPEVMQLATLLKALRTQVSAGSCAAVGGDASPRGGSRAEVAGLSQVRGTAVCEACYMR